MLSALGVVIRVKASVLRLGALECEGHAVIRPCEVWEGHAVMGGAMVVGVLGWRCYANEGLWWE